MNTSVDTLGHLRLQFHIQHPALDAVWMEGYTFATAEGAEEENPYPANTKENEYWTQGWWSGFYGEAPLFDLSTVSEITSYTQHELADVAMQDAANEPEWVNPSVRLWAGRVAKLAGAIAVTVAAIELLDLAV